MALAFFLFTLCKIVYNDFAKRRIFNFTIIICFLTGTYLVFFGRVGFSNNFSNSFLSFFMFFMFFMPFYFLGFMGAGDVKYGSVLAFCFGAENFLMVLMVSLIITILYSSLHIFFDKYGFGKISFSSTNQASEIKRKNIPYGAFLSMASIFHILKQAYL